MRIDNVCRFSAIRTVTINKRLAKIRRCQSFKNELQILLQDARSYLHSIAKRSTMSQQLPFIQHNCICI